MKQKLTSRDICKNS